MYRRTWVPRQLGTFPEAASLLPCLASMHSRSSYGTFAGPLHRVIARMMDRRGGFLIDTRESIR